MSGLQAIASALAVELMVSVLHHPLGAAADDDLSEGGGSAGSGGGGGGGGGGGRGGGGGGAPPPGSCLGGVPHQVRGQLSRFGTECMRGSHFVHCTACSDTVVQRLREGGAHFLMQARPARLG